eukprot:scaffold77949_cov33-Phaeocystis_antarctica.AAC.1
MEPSSMVMSTSCSATSLATRVRSALRGWCWQHPPGVGHGNADRRVARLYGARGLHGGREARADGEDGHARTLLNALRHGLDDAALADGQHLAPLRHLLE